MSERLHVRIARSGLCSRRAAEALIREGRVGVNGETVMEMGHKVEPSDTVSVDGAPLSEAELYTLLLNKPTGYVTTLHDPQGRQTIKDLLPDYGVQLKPVGRLDYQTEGLLIVTNDGELANRLMHPRYEIDKEYEAFVEGIPDEKKLARFRRGIYLEKKRTAPAEIAITHVDREREATRLKIVLHEGRKRQVREMCHAIGHPVKTLKRVRIGPFLLKGMRPGECRLLGKRDVEKLRESVGLKGTAGSSKLLP